MDEPRPAGLILPNGAPASPLGVPTRAQIELAARGLPATPQQVSWAISRPGPRRTPMPAVGDEVLYRHDSWQLPIPAVVEWVQPDDDVDDPHVCQVQTDDKGGVLLVEGRSVFITNPDPWLSVILRVTLDGHEVRPLTREARLPGSPGWLPLDWETRWRPMPWEV